MSNVTDVVSNVADVASNVADTWSTSDYRLLNKHTTNTDFRGLFSDSFSQISKLKVFFLIFYNQQVSSV